MEEQKISPSQLMMLIFVSVFSFVVMTPATGGISLMSVIAAVIVVIPLLLLMVLPCNHLFCSIQSFRKRMELKDCTLLYRS